MPLRQCVMWPGVHYRHRVTIHEPAAAGAI